LRKEEIQVGDHVRQSRKKPGVVIDIRPDLMCYVLVRENNGQEILWDVARVERALPPKCPTPKKPKIKWAEVVVDFNKWVHEKPTYIYVEIPHDEAMFAFEKRWNKLKGVLVESEAIKRYNSPDWWFYSLRLIAPTPPDTSWVVQELKPDFLSDSRVRISNNAYIWELLIEGFDLGQNNPSENQGAI